MKHKLLITFLSFCLSITLSMAQSGISGKVTDETGEPLPGVNVTIEGTATGTVTGLDGNFNLSADEGSVLLFSFVGYQTQRLTVGSRTSYNITLEPDVQQLSEVVVIGYGETTIKDATGAVASVSSEDFNGGVISSPEQLIQGKTAGVQITNSSGNPGDGVQLRIRGTTSIRSDNNPLFVVDGVPLSGGAPAASADVGYGTSANTNPLNFINPNDIESISILKDASATAIYGSRGANGVVIITTKDGRGKGTFDFASSISISSPANEYDLLDREGFLNGVAQYGSNPSDLDFGADTDWQDYITRTSISHKQNLAYSRGYETASIRASIGYEDQQGIIEDSYMKRFTTRINAKKSLLDDKLNLDLSATYSNVRREDPPISGSAGFEGDLLGAAYSANPTWPTDPEFNAGTQRNPANMLETFQSEAATNRLLTNLSASYNLTDNLVAKATYGLDYIDNERVTLVTPDAIGAGDGVQGFGQGQLDGSRNINHLGEFTLTYTKQLDNIKIEAVAGYSIQTFRNDFFFAQARGFVFSDFSNMEDELRSAFNAADAAAGSIYEDYNNWGVTGDLRSNDPNVPGLGAFVGGINFDDAALERTFIDRPAGVGVDGIAANFFDQTDFIQSYFGRANITLSDKYILTATVRADGSSRFGEDNKYGIFPSGAVAWKMHEEVFMPDAFNTFKIRASYGIVGNQDGLGYGNFIRRARWADATVGNARQIDLPGTTVSGDVRPDLQWESTTQTGAGVDFGFIDNRLTGSFDWYLKNTTDLLLRIFPAQPSLVPIQFENLDATVQNRGWELALNYIFVDNDDISFDVGGNISRNINEVQDFAGELNSGTIYGQGLTGAFAQRLTTGRSLFTYYLRDFQGFDDSGQPIGDEQTYIGKNALPEYNMGLSINARYKRFDLAMYFAGQFGFYVYNNTQNAFFTAGSIASGRNVTEDVLGNGEAGSAAAAVSTRFLEKGDFVRMQNLSIGYNVPLENVDFINNFRVYFNAQNLFLITDYSGLDPEISTSAADFDLLNSLPTAGIDYTAYPRPRVFTLGLNVKF